MSRLEERIAFLEKEKSRLLRRIYNFEEKERLMSVQNINSVNQMLNGRQELYDKLEACLEKGGGPNQEEL